MVKMGWLVRVRMVAYGTGLRSFDSSFEGRRLGDGIVVRVPWSGMVGLVEYEWYGTASSCGSGLVE